MSFVSNDSDILSVQPSYHVLQPWLANDFQEPLNITTLQPIVPVLPMVPEGYTICDIFQRVYKTPGFTKNRNNCLKKSIRNNFY